MNELTGHRQFGQANPAVLLSSPGRHYEESVFVTATPEEIFDYADDHGRFSSHMTRSSWMMGGGRMDVRLDEGKGKAIGSHIRLSGKVCGIRLFLDEVVTRYDRPVSKEWQTVGNPRLVMGHYRMGWDIRAADGGSRFGVFIEYDLPESSGTRWLGYLLGHVYARWCVKQMIQGVRAHFEL